MSNFYAILRTVHKNVHDLPMKQFSEPKIYTGGVDIDKWDELTKEQQTKALSKRWYVYFSFRNPETKKLVRQTNIHADVNHLKTKKERYYNLNLIRERLKALLILGFNPYVNNQELYDNLHTSSKVDNTANIVKHKEQSNTVIQNVIPSNNITIQSAFDTALEQKSAV
ncbi:MAG: site-specific integrase, partial [Bacteroidota bacterium]|nr:site-specific integrase [Bacteroidota bacterium]